MGTYSELLKTKPSTPPGKAGQGKDGSQNPIVPTPQKQIGKKKKQPINRDTTTPRHHDTTASRYHDTTIEMVRKAVKKFGKEAATHRFTLEEKNAIAGIVYSYKNQGIRTSENEITRIAINFIINDYRENGGNSILERALRALDG